ncbi:UNVERIFIED_CONTAM: hypothetical protein Slati_0185700 [Sesamum latifolium]|uniref:Uncharacterized protein n=1 Tax=Sesamum latifolium TaxID=2727402 RepID=A0AAW2YBH4_9LAMI
MELGNIPLDLVDASLYGFIGGVVHPLGQILLPLSLGTEPTRRTRMTRFLVANMRLAYNMILGQLVLNTFQVVASTYHMRLKFPVGTKVGEVKYYQYTTHKCYVEVIREEAGR